MPEAVLCTTGKPVHAGGPELKFCVNLEGNIGRRPY